MLNLLIFLTAFGGFLPAAPPTEDPPNVILIVADDLGLHDLGSYGNPVIETPRLDALAAGGLRFTRAYAAAPICSPSRLAIQTGLYPARAGMTEHLRGTPPPDPCQPLIAPKNVGRLALAYTTLGEAMLELGYRTAYVGKWHLGGSGYDPTAHGYETSLAAGSQGLPRSFFRPFFNGNPFPELNTIAGDDQYLTDAITTLAIETLPAAAAEEPFFLNLNYYSPHVPIEGPPELVAKYEALLGGSPDTLPRPHYAAMVETIDRQVGRLIDTLAARGLLENTVVLFTSDHGALTVEEVPGFDQHTPPTDSGPLRGGKGSVYEGGLKVPLIAYAPGRLPAAVIDEPTVNTDFMPTLTALAGKLKTTYDSAPIPALTGLPATDRSLFFHFPHYSPQRGRPAAAIINNGNKLIDWYSNVDSLYLFDLAADGGEQLDLSTTEAARRDRLLTELTTWRDSVGARFMTPNPNFDPLGCQ